MQGAPFKKPGDIGKTLESLRKEKPQVLVDAQRQIDELERTHAAALRRAGAAVQALGAVQFAPERLAREALIAGGLLEEDVTEQGFRKRLDEVQRLRAARDAMRRKKAIGVERREVYPDEIWGGRSLIFEKDIEKRLTELRGHELLRALNLGSELVEGIRGAAVQPGKGAEIPAETRAAAERGAQTPTITQNIINNTINQGTVIRYDEYGMRIGDTREPLDIERL